MNAKWKNLYDEVYILVRFSNKFKLFFSIELFALMCLFTIEAAVVRIMKARKRLQHNVLVTEVEFSSDFSTLLPDQIILYCITLTI